MNQITQILGTKLTVVLRPCSLCPGNAKVFVDHWEAHQKRHLFGDNLECCMCRKTKPKLAFQVDFHIKAPICHRCRTKKSQRKGTGRPPVPEKVAVRAIRSAESKYAGNEVIGPKKIRANEME